MPQHQVISTDRAPQPVASYSQGRIVNGFLYTAGFGPQDPATGELTGDDIASQTEQVMKNVAAVLAEAGLDFTDVVKTTVHLQHLDRDFAGYNEVYSTFVTEPFPVRTTVGSQLANILVEVDVVAALRD